MACTKRQLEAARRYRERHPDRLHAWDKKNPEKRKASRFKTKCTAYGVTTDGYFALLHSQNGVCAICGHPETQKGWSLSVDHDHKCCPGRKSCGKCVRGLLCSKCNQAIGLLKDAPQVAESAARYLRRFEEEG